MSKYDRLAGLKEAAEEGFEHTNPARVNMSKEEEESKKYFKEKLSQMTESNISKDLYPISEKDIEIIVEGHTDTDKLNSSSSPKNNWELSVLRATSVVQILLNNSSMTPSQIMAGGRGEFLPIDVSDKAKNRRIEVIISPNLNELFEIISND